MQFPDFNIFKYGKRVDLQKLGNLFGGVNVFNHRGDFCFLFYLILFNLA